MNKYNNQSQYRINQNNEFSDIQKSWLMTKTIDYWRHSRMFYPIIPIIQIKPGSTWITIGDGRLGLDSIKLKNIEPSNNILPTDIDTTLLEKAKEMKLISEYRMEDAEKLSFPNESFDYSFCKESFHHFQKPYMGLYEMIRVSKKAIILIEPSDTDKKPVLLILIEWIKKIVKFILFKSVKHPDFYRFEESGNYVYTVSKREIEKVSIAMQLPTIAIYNFNDYYEEGLEYIPNKISVKFINIKYKILKQNIKAKLGLAMYTGIIAIIFKEKPEEKLKEKLEEKGFKFTDLPVNPYLKI